MFKIIFISLVILQSFADDCNSINPVCGVNGVTYANVCKCKEAKIDVGYVGACKVEGQIEWVKKPEESQRHFKWFSPKEKKEKGDDLIALKWTDYSWEYPGWGDQQRLDGFQFQNARLGIQVRPQEIQAQVVQPVAKKIIPQFQFPTPQIAIRQPLPQMNFSIQPQEIKMNPSPKQFFSTPDQNWVSYDESEQIPAKYVLNEYKRQNVGGLEVVKIPEQQQLKTQQEEVSNDWNSKIENKILTEYKQYLEKNKANSHAAAQAFDDVNLSGAGYKEIQKQGQAVKAKDTLFQSNFQPDYSWLNKQTAQQEETQKQQDVVQLEAATPQRQVTGNQVQKTIGFDQIVEKQVKDFDINSLDLSKQEPVVMKWTPQTINLNTEKIQQVFQSAQSPLSPQTWASMKVGNQQQVEVPEVEAFQWIEPTNSGVQTQVGNTLAQLIFQ